MIFFFAQKKKRLEIGILAFTGDEMLTINNFLFNAQIDNINLFKVTRERHVRLLTVAFSLGIANLCPNGLPPLMFQLQKYFEKSMISRKVRQVWL